MALPISKTLFRIKKDSLDQEVSWIQNLARKYAHSNSETNTNYTGEMAEKLKGWMKLNNFLMARKSTLNNLHKEQIEERVEYKFGQETYQH